MRLQVELYRRTGNQASKLAGTPRPQSRKWQPFELIIAFRRAAGTAAAWLKRDSQEVNAEGQPDMTRIGTRAEVWFCNIVASFARYVAERSLPESVPMLMRRDAVLDAFDYAKTNMQDAYSFLDRFEGLSLSIDDARRRFPSRTRVLEFGVYKAGM